MESLPVNRFSMYGMGFGSWFGSIGELVWLIVGVLAIIWLWGQIQKK